MCKQTCNFYLQPFNFYLQVFIYDVFVPPGIKGLNGIYTGLFQCGHFQRPLVLNIFSTLSLKYEASKFSPKCYVTKLSTYCFNVHITMLWWLFYKLLFRVGPWQLVLCDITFIFEKKWMCAWIFCILLLQVYNLVSQWKSKSKSEAT